MTGTLTEGDGGGKFVTGTCGTGSGEGTAILFSCNGALCSIPPRRYSMPVLVTLVRRSPGPNSWPSMAGIGGLP